MPQLKTAATVLLIAAMTAAAYLAWSNLGSAPAVQFIPLPPAPATPLAIDASYAHSDATYVGSRNCKDCHEQAYKDWRGSHHDLAMDHATEQTVVADFGDTTFTHHGITSRFFREDGKFVVETEGHDGKLHTYPVQYVFGVTPLQQYLVEFPGGRLQTLPLCWDSRPTDQGGQRWFHIYGDERIAPDDELFWTKVVQNWNFMCAECHSTNLRKNYDVETRSYTTTFAEIDVACEACHGPGSEHVQWASLPDYQRADDNGLVVDLDNGNDGHWQHNVETGHFERSAPLTSRVQVEMCARCHARRQSYTQDYEHGRRFHETHRQAMLDAGVGWNLPSTFSSIPFAFISSVRTMPGSMLRTRRPDSGYSARNAPAMRWRAAFDAG